ncbi:hypothetical protein OGAPHI_001616 [Ogataea philodendri]|uniref:Ribosome biogenesis protein NSA1 n=1 Tax=Ogataea philodendri TaxID=1378263 RepID=A0A9P8PD49_9ASCO|nr:uncharacterized protein OGAPHI_001616 [Ogataea philodendri]KAH3669495.1 hypothetical protein OGAPHI_001616 [Ogataea philodendri]
MKLLVSAEESGALKEIVCERGTDTSKQQAVQPSSIRTVCQETRDTRVQIFILYEKYLIAARKGGLVTIYDIGDKYTEIKRLEGLSNSPEDVFVALFQLHGKIYACTEEGKVSIVEPESWAVEHVSIKGPISSFVGDQFRPDVFAYGGKENDLVVIDLATKKELYKVKNVPNNKLDLREPVWISKIAFATEKDDKKDVYKLITVTRYGQVRFYDSAHGRRPVLNFKLSDKPLITLAKLDDHSIVCSDTHTTTAKFDFKTGKMLGKFQGAVGSIQAIDVHSGLLATGGLDRYVRCFDLESREVVAKVYLGTQISDVRVVEAEEQEVAAESAAEQKQPAVEEEEDAESSDDDDDDEMWQKLETTLVEKRKRRKLK